jgi:hypothetical protein
MDSEIKSKITKLARNEGKTASQMVRELIENYIKERDIGSYIDNLWDRIGDKLSSKGTGINDIEKAIREVRAAKK